ncbi:hypothetical protein RJ55_07494 [Drechmeria coniospora]|nr:hypothetical protein RJ55_07494 [Drechmeria coniospora]
MMAADLSLPSSKDVLRERYVGKSIVNVDTPAAVINLAAAKRNCERMLQTCDALSLGWRAHVKTHKTVELARLQVGDDAGRPVQLIVSTVAEAEFLTPMLSEYRRQGRRVNVLYGLPLPKGAVSRLAAVARTLGEGSVSILLDDPAQLAMAADMSAISDVAPHAYIKVDMGGRRAGVVVDGKQFPVLVDAALDAHGRGSIQLAGLYSHAGHSYAGDGRVAALRMMSSELTSLLDGADRVRARASAKGIVDLPSLTLSAGASPTTLSLQNVADDEDEKGAPSGTPSVRAEAGAISTLLETIKGRGHAVEVHAGVYPLLDLQQLAAHSIRSTHLSWSDMAFTVLAEVHSIYAGRGADGTDEALVGAGCLALGREPCKAYAGMAIPTAWNRAGVEKPTFDVERYEGYVVGRVSQEHGILQWRDGRGTASPTTEATAADRKLDVEVGQKIRLWPNHACIAGSQFGWYLVVDEDGKGDEIVDVWIRARGW